MILKYLIENKRDESLKKMLFVIDCKRIFFYLFREEKMNNICIYIYILKILKIN